MVILENICKAILKNIDIDKAVLKIIDINIGKAILKNMSIYRVLFSCPEQLNRTQCLSLCLSLCYH